LVITIQPLNGTNIQWKAEEKETSSHLVANTSFYVQSDNREKELAFSAIVDYYFDYTFDVDKNKTVLLKVMDLQLNEFRITQDNCGTKADEENIKRRLSKFMGTVQNIINDLLPSYQVKLPTFNTFDYILEFNYEDQALGIGSKIIKEDK
jgi:hypothetical protein